MHKVNCHPLHLRRFRNTSEGLPKQDDDTLRETREYIDALLTAREREEPVSEEGLPAGGEPVGSGSSGTVYLEHRTCGDETCSCMNGGEKHGPYRYRAYRHRDTVRREYLGKATDDA